MFRRLSWALSLPHAHTHTETHTKLCTAPVLTPSAVTWLALSRCLSLALSWGWLLRQGNSLHSHTETHTLATVANWMARAGGPGLYAQGEEPWIFLFHLDFTHRGGGKRWMSVGTNSYRLWIFTFLKALWSESTRFQKIRWRRSIRFIYK